MSRTVPPSRAPGAGERGLVARAGYRGLWGLGRALTALYWRLEVVGADRLPTSGPFVIAPVHRSNLDFFLVGMISPRPIRWMAKSSIFLGGWIDRFLMAMGAFPVQRDRVDRDALRQCEALLRAGEPVVVFPEGRRRDGPVVHEVFDGPAFVACRQRVPVVPVGIGGSDRAMPIGSKWIRPRKVAIVVGEPLYPDVSVEGRVPRSTVTSFSVELRAAVQDAYDESKRLAGVS